MLRLSTGSVACVLVVLAAGAIAGAQIDGLGWWLHWICKPLATLCLLIWLAGKSGIASHQRYHHWVMAGMALSLLGDVLLMLPHGLFVPGLVAFLLAHLCYMTAFAPGVRWRMLPPSLAVGLLLAGGNLLGLWDRLPEEMRLPVSVYVLVIAWMFALALARFLSAQQGGRAAAVGAFLFVVSDSWLAWDRFAGPLPWAIAGILLTYWAAQFAIASSVRIHSTAALQ